MLLFFLKLKTLPTTRPNGINDWYSVLDMISIKVRRRSRSRSQY